MEAVLEKVDLTGLPTPEGAPSPGACVRIERPEEGLAVIVLDPPHRPKLAVLDMPLLRDLGAALEEVAGDPSVTGLVITGRSPLSFAGGADVEGISDLHDRELALRVGRLGQTLFQELALLGSEHGGRLRTVAAVGGPVPGGAFELSLACDRIVLAEDKKSRIGLPEVRLGILPGWGGCQRLPRRVGVPAALGAILTGKLYVPRQAVKVGLVDRLTHPSNLLRIAADHAMGRAPIPRRTRGIWGWLVDRNPLAAAVIGRKSTEAVMKQTHGHYPAPLRAQELVLAAPRTPIEQGLEKEAEALADLAVSPVCKSLVGIFLLSEEAKKLGHLPDGTQAPRIARGGVVGAGIMGGAIASLMAQRGIQTRLADIARPQLDASVSEHRKQMDKRRKRRRMQRHEAMAAVDRLRSSSELVGFGRSEVVIEAVAERMEVKLAVLGALAEQMGPDAILASNTSSLSIDEMAAQLPNPERVVGIHFFNPVRMMPLVEIVRGSKTSDEVVTTACRLALDLGKTPVVTADCAGFLVNRLLGPYLDEAARLFEEGCDPEELDRLAVGFGMPMGPFELLDEVGLDIAAHAGASLHTAYGDRMCPSELLQGLVEAGEFGKKSGTGVYVWEKGKKGRPVKRGPNPRMAGLSRPSGGGPDPTTAVDRLILAMVNEAARALEEEVVAGPRELDLASVFGMGFAPFRGGMLKYADARGLADVRDTLGRLAESPAIASRPGGVDKFRPAALIERLAGENGSFHA